jgi:hypothetical protein
MLVFTSLQAAAFEKLVKYRNIKVEMVSDKPLTTGINKIKLHVLKGSNPIKDANVAVKFFMPAMPGMPYMEYKTVAKPLGNAVYEATFNASMGGTWQVHIFITTKDGKKYRLKSSVNL